MAVWEWPRRSRLERRASVSAASVVHPLRDRERLPRRLRPRGDDDPVAIVASALRVLAGLALGFVAAITTGILISASRTVSDMVMPIVRGLAPIAPIAWIPLGIMLFGIGNPTAIFVVFMGVYLHPDDLDRGRGRRASTSN